MSTKLKIQKAFVESYTEPTKDSKAKIKAIYLSICATSWGKLRLATLDSCYAPIYFTNTTPVVTGLAYGIDNDGLGYDSLLEIPYIAGSSVRGIWADAMRIYANWSPDSPNFIDFFGTNTSSAQKGKLNVIGLYAKLDEGTRWVDYEVMTCLTGRPNPLAFPVIKAKLTWHLYATGYSAEMLPPLKIWLKEMGIGGKTSSGMGRFEELTQKIEPTTMSSRASYTEKSFDGMLRNLTPGNLDQIKNELPKLKQAENSEFKKKFQEFLLKNKNLAEKLAKKPWWVPL